MATHVSDYTKTSPEIVLDLINHDNSTTLTAQKIAMAAPVAVGGVATKLTLKGKPAQGTKGSVIVNYNRVGISVIPGIDDVVDMGGVESAPMTDVVAKVNAALGINMSAEDIKIDGVEITDESISFPEAQIVDAVFMAKPTSLVWFGTAAVKLIRALVALDVIVTVSALSNQGLRIANVNKDIVYGRAQKDYVVKDQFTYDNYAATFDYPEVLNRPYNSIYRVVLQAVRYWGPGGQERFGFIAGAPKTSGDLSESPFSGFEKLPFQEALDATWPGKYLVTQHAAFMDLEMKVFLVVKDVVTGQFDVAVLWWAYEGTGVGRAGVYGPNVISDIQVEDLMFGVGFDGAVITREQAGNLYEYIYYTVEADGLRQFSIFRDSRKFIGNIGATGYSKVVNMQYEKNTNEWGISVGIVTSIGYNEYNDISVMPEGYSNPETLTRGIIATYPTAGYNNYNYAIMTWNTPDKDCVVKAVEIQHNTGAGTAWIAKAGYVESVRNTCGLHGDLEASLIHCNGTQQQNMIYTIVHPKCEGRPGIPGRGALSIYNSLHISDLAEIFYGFKPAGDTIAMQWTETGGMRDHEFGTGLICTYNDDLNNFHIYHAAGGLLKLTAFWPELTPRPGFRGVTKKAGT